MSSMFDFPDNLVASPECQFANIVFDDICFWLDFLKENYECNLIIFFDTLISLLKGEKASYELEKYLKGRLKK